VTRLQNRGGGYACKNGWRFGGWRSPDVVGGSGRARREASTNLGIGEEPLISSIRGENLYGVYCASCHGEDGKGNGAMAAWLKVPPADLTRIAARNGGKFPLERVDRIISGQEALPSGHGTRAMPIWGPVFSQVTRDQDLGKVRIDNLARYLRDIQSR